MTFLTKSLTKRSLINRIYFSNEKKSIFKSNEKKSIKSDMLKKKSITTCVCLVQISYYGKILLFIQEHDINHSGKLNHIQKFLHPRQLSK
jgi:hypothetical protein